MSDIIGAELVSGLDQPISFDPSPLLDEIEKEYMKIREHKNVEMVLGQAQGLISTFRSSGLALAKLLYLLKQDWAFYEVNDRFEDSVFSYLGLSKITTERYLSVWEIFGSTHTPEQFKSRLQLLPMKSLIPIASAVKQGYEMDLSDWEELAGAHDESTIRAKLRDLKGQEPRKSGITLKMNTDGDIRAYCAGQGYNVGYLDVANNHEVVQKAIERIINSCGIVRT